jgi:hypothetical protein
MRNEHAKAKAQKRGGEAVVLSMDMEDTHGEHPVQPGCDPTPEQYYRIEHPNIARLLSGDSANRIVLLADNYRDPVGSSDGDRSLLLPRHITDREACQRFARFPCVQA